MERHYLAEDSTTTEHYGCPMMMKMGHSMSNQRICFPLTLSDCFEIWHNCRNCLLVNEMRTHLNVVRIGPFEAITESRRKKWQQLIQSTDITHNRKTWKQLGFSEMTRLTPNQPRPLVTANQVAHQLLVNSRGNRVTHTAIREQSKAADTDFTIPFSMNDLCGAIKEMKSNKAARLDNILCEQIKHIGLAALQLVAWHVQWMYEHQQHP